MRCFCLGGVGTCSDVDFRGQKKRCARVRLVSTWSLLQFAVKTSVFFSDTHFHSVLFDLKRSKFWKSFSLTVTCCLALIW